MTATGILFPGQGAQAVGMGRWLIETFSIARDRFAQASDVLGYDLAKLCLDGPADRLHATEFSQPALFTVGIAAVEALASQHPDRLAGVVATAGLSLGEYTAVCYAGGLDFQDALKLVQRRGQAMQAAADATSSGMASVLGMELEDLEILCDSCRKGDEVLQPANLLCKGNIAVSGHQTAIDRLIAAAIDAGATKVIPLTVAGAFHTPIMGSAVEALKAALDEMPIRNTRIPVYSNVDAGPHQSADEIRVLLARQVVGPVLWGQSIEKMIADGVSRFEELGTGRVLRGIMKRIDRKMPIDGFGDGD
jgi:[acyl-carrier-protein] S-malonyltransferase